SIDLDNIIHYQPPAIPKPPCKPLHSTASSHASSHPPSNQPVLTHPLPPRPLCPSYESPRTCYPCPQNPSPIVSSLPFHRDAYLNDFDNELADLEMTGHALGGEKRLKQTASTTPKEVNSINSTVVSDLLTYGLLRLLSSPAGALHFQLQPRHMLTFKEASCNDDRSCDDLRLLSEDATMPRDTAASSYNVETHRSFATGTPTSPVAVDGHISLNELCSFQDPSPFKRNEPQLSILGYETEVNSMVAGEPRHGRPSNHNYNISRDLAPSPNPTTTVPAGDEPNPANFRPLRSSPESSAERYKPSSPPAMEAHFP
ncbi:hypothetical protein F1880_008347, partial [Penicillium rolfsii]